MACRFAASSSGGRLVLTTRFTGGGAKQVGTAEARIAVCVSITLLPSVCWERDARRGRWPGSKGEKSSVGANVAGTTEIRCARHPHASDDAGLRKPCDLAFHPGPLDSINSDAQQSKAVEFVPPLGEGMRAMSGRLVR